MKYYTGLFQAWELYEGEQDYDGFREQYRGDHPGYSFDGMNYIDYKFSHLNFETQDGTLKRYLMPRLGQFCEVYGQPRMDYLLK